MEKQTQMIKTELKKSESYQRHQRQRFWQIFTPVGLGVLLILAIAVMVILTASGTSAGGPVSQWADISLIWVLLPVLGFAIIAAMIFFAMIYLVARILNILPVYTLVVQQYLQLITAQVNYWSYKIVTPVVTVKSYTAGVSAFFSALLGQSHR